ncbi:hypothetical protein BK004_03670 [bacterium CG10_46_32]|nr:MAG: hypothetical protein BK004_03670 [bacterium CG10_46_32]PIR55897.1 MAG: hypothetical protein COU73_03700 [Parcubacteria group bacterium CG10_big_fil_rev_8_21_14_0_10_46_32]
MSELKNQHIIPQCYLKQFVDPNTPKGYEPYVWIFERGKKIGKKKAPKNILAETDFYTLKTKFGGKDYIIEQSLSQLEGEYASIFEKKIKTRLPLNNFEHVIVCAFVAAMLQRTLKQKENIEGFLDELIEMAEDMEKAHSVPPKKSLELKEEKKNAHKTSVLKMIPHITEILLKMNIAFLCSNKRGSFITSDAPCFLFNPRLQWQRFYGPGLIQRDVEVRMPLSSEISISFSWINNLRGYLGIDTNLIHDCNRMTFGHSHQYFIANSPKIKRRWFRKFPLDPVFMIKILKNKIWPQVKYWAERQFRKYVRF